MIQEAVREILGFDLNLFLLGLFIHQIHGIKQRLSNQAGASLEDYRIFFQFYHLKQRIQYPVHFLRLHMHFVQKMFPLFLRKTSPAFSVRTQDLLIHHDIRKRGLQLVGHVRDQALNLLLFPCCLTDLCAQLFLYPLCLS